MTGDLVLLTLACVVALFAGACWMRLLTLLKQDAEEREALDRWYAARAEARRQRTDDPSSLLDDSPSALPDVWRRDGEVVEFHPKRSA